MDKAQIYVINSISIAIYGAIGIKVLFSEYLSVSVQLSWYFGFILFGLISFGLLESLCFILYKPFSRR